MAIADKLTKLSTDITNAYTAIDNKGGTIPANKNTENLASSISSISGGGSTIVEENDVNFYDYDGTLLYSYSASDFLALTEMPSNPSHSGLTAQGWNWTLANAKTQVTNLGKVDIGQLYVTDDGDTRIYITLDEGRKSPYLGIAVNGTVTVDWGDNSETSTVTGTSLSTAVNTLHEYANEGDYIIRITPEENTTFTFVGNSTYGSYVLWANISTANSANKTYQNSIQKVEFGTGIVSLSDRCFLNCGNLKQVIIPNNITYINQYSFSNCYSLKNIIFPINISAVTTNIFSVCYSLKNVVLSESVRTLGQNAFNGCSSLQKIIIPYTINNFGNYMFWGCYSLKEIVIPTSQGNGSNAGWFRNCYSLEKVILNSKFTSLGDYGFNSCYSLKKIILSSAVTAISNNAFSDCRSLNYIKIPSRVTRINDYAFSNCHSMGYYDFSECTSIPTLSASAFNSIPSDCKIIVPDDLYDTWITRTNWSTYASYIVKASDVSI